MFFNISWAESRVKTANIANMFVVLTNADTSIKIGKMASKKFPLSGKLYKNIGSRIRRARAKNGISQIKLAAQVGLTRTSICNIEYGRQKILLDTLWQIAGILKVPIMDLIPQVKEVTISPIEELPSNTPIEVKSYISQLVQEKNE